MSEVQAIAEQAFVYAYPMVMNYGTIYQYAIDTTSPEYKRRSIRSTTRPGSIRPRIVTMYDAKTQLLVANPIDRYLINSPMLPTLKKNAHGSITLYLQKDSPGKDKESNWLPAPDGPIYVAMRLYWPNKAALAGKWKPPAVVRGK